jgi:hypothetical protein
MNDEESFKSPELQRLEDEVKLMEAEMEAAHLGLEEYQVNTYSESVNTYSESECDVSDFVDIPLPDDERFSSALVLAASSTATATPISPNCNTTLLSTPYADALKTLALLCTSIPRGLGLAFVIFFFSVNAQMHPTAPQSGCTISLLLALFQIKSVSWQQQKGKTRIVSLVTMIVITIIFDVDWLISNYFAESLGENDDFEFKLTQATSFVWQMAWWAVAINIFVKVMSICDFLEVGSVLRGYIVPDKKDVSTSVSQKVILITWVELLSSLLFFVYFFLIQSDVVSGRMDVFNEAPVQMLSVQATLLFKGTSGIFVFLSLVHHIKIRDLCGLKSSCCCVVDSRQTRRSRKTIVSSLKRSLKCIAVTKALDFFVVGAMLWTSLLFAQANIHYDAPKDVKAMLILMTVTNSFTSLTPLLVGSIIWSIRLSEKQKEESRQESMHQNTPHSSSRRASRHIRSADRRSITSPDASAYDYDNSYDYDFGSPNVRSSQSLFSTRLVAASPTPSAPPSAPPIQQQTPHQYTSYNLDLNLYCTPREFESEWKNLSSGSSTEEYPISNIPSLSQCNLHFNQLGWSIIASGVVENVTKLFLIAQRKIQMPVRRSGANPHSSSLRKTTAYSRCLAQLSFVNGMNPKMTLEMRCQNEDHIDFFISSLELITLFNSVA